MIKPITLWKPTNNDITTTYYVYIITCKLNRKKYIGQTSNIEKRKHEHLTFKNVNPLMNDDIKLYGLKYFDFNIITTTHDVQQAKQLECENILLHRTLYPTGYNRSLSLKNYHKVITFIRMRKYDSLDWLLCEDDLIRRRKMLITRHINNLEILSSIPITQPSKLYDVLLKRSSQIIGHTKKYNPQTIIRQKNKYSILYDDAFDVWNYVSNFTDKTFTFDNYLNLRNAFNYPYDSMNLNEPDYNQIPLITQINQD